MQAKGYDTAAFRSLRGIIIITITNYVTSALRRKTPRLQVP